MRKKGQGGFTPPPPKKKKKTKTYKNLKIREAFQIL
jgi:hypothetical protein